ncbi:MAG: hypothetical protein GXY68_00105 [Chloroflexi bacterium]|jgi:hypothetical protein|nr:hypothetical protein [Chloroflexota bacterium]
MRNSTLMAVFLLLGLLCWAGLVYLMHSTYPDARAQFVFLAIWAGAMVLTAAPLSYLFYQRLGRSLGRSGDLARVLRQGLLLAIATGVMVGLQFLGFLRLGTALVLLFIAVLIEIAFALQEGVRH